jgi:hypothetical protein
MELLSAISDVALALRANEHFPDINVPVSSDWRKSAPNTAIFHNQFHQRVRTLSAASPSTTSMSGLCK